MNKGKSINCSSSPGVTRSTSRYEQLFQQQRPFVRGSAAHHVGTANDDIQRNAQLQENSFDYRMAYGDVVVDTERLNDRTFGRQSGSGHSTLNRTNNRSVFPGSGVPQRARQQNSRSEDCFSNLVNRSGMPLMNEQTASVITPSNTFTIPWGQSNRYFNNLQTTAGPRRPANSIDAPGTNRNSTNIHADAPIESRQNHGIPHSHVSAAMNCFTNRSSYTSRTNVRPRSGPMGSFVLNGQMNSSAPSGTQMSAQQEETHPTAIVFKNIPFQLIKEQLLAIIKKMGLPEAYAFDYFFSPHQNTADRIFSGLAFANYNTAEEANRVRTGLNGLCVMNRVLIVEQKRVESPAQREENQRKKAERRGQTMEHHQPIPPSQVIVPYFKPAPVYHSADDSSSSGSFALQSKSTKRTSPLDPTAAEFTPSPPPGGALDDESTVHQLSHVSQSATESAARPDPSVPEYQPQVTQPSTSAAQVNTWISEPQPSQSPTMADVHAPTNQIRPAPGMPIARARQSIGSLMNSAPGARQAMLPHKTSRPALTRQSAYRSENWRDRPIDGVHPGIEPFPPYVSPVATPTLATGKNPSLAKNYLSQTPNLFTSNAKPQEPIRRAAVQRAN